MSRCRYLLGGHGVLENADSLDLDLDAVSGCELSAPAGRTGEDDVTGHQGGERREVADDERDVEDQLRSIRFLTGLAVYAARNRNPPGDVDVRLDHRPDRTK